MPVFSDLQLVTGRLLLRPLTEGDAGALFALCSDPEVMRYAGSLPWTEIGQAQQRIQRHLNAMASDEYLCLGIVLRSDKDTAAPLIGSCTLFNLSEPCRRAEIGYSLARAYWGQGYMHEALMALVSYGFQDMHLNRIEADIDPRNLASEKSLKRLGFRLEGYLRERWIVDGVVSDSGLYGLLASEWPPVTAGVSHASR